jgi:methyl-accepting chemotaxis protein
MIKGLTIARQLWLMAGISICFFVLLALAGLYSARSVREAGDAMGLGKDLVADVLPPPLFLVEASLTARQMLESADAKTQGKYADDLKRLRKEYDERIEFWKVSTLDKDIKLVLLGNQRMFADLWWKEAWERFLPAVERGDRQAALASLKAMDAHYLAHRAGVDATTAKASAFADNSLNALRDSDKGPVGLLIALASAGAIFAFTIAFFVLRRLARGFREAVATAKLIAIGDLTRPVPVAGQDELGELLVQMSVMQENLLDIARQIRENVQILNEHSRDLAKSSGEVSGTATMQAEMASGMAAAVEELSVSIDQVENHAADALRITGETSARSVEGAAVITDAVGEMRNIAHAVTDTAESIGRLEGMSGKISGIAKVIKGIAEQTNLLALNAAIEAARAGEHGRGFSVVADEVRKLSEHTAGSTREITEMIEQIQKGAHEASASMEAGAARVTQGTDLAGRAGTSIDGIRADTERVNQAVGDISHALQEQATATREIAKRVEGISHGTEELSNSASRTAAAAGELTHVAQSLDRLSHRFQFA